MYRSKISACILNLYDIDVTGYEKSEQIKLHLFDIESVKLRIIVGDGIAFGQKLISARI